MTSKSLAPIEKYFSRIKSGVLTDDREYLGKKKFKKIIGMLVNKALKLRPSLIVNTWHHCSLAIVDYLALKTILK